MIYVRPSSGQGPQSVRTFPHKEKSIVPKYDSTDVDFWSGIARLIFEQAADHRHRFTRMFGKDLNGKVQDPLVAFSIVLGFREVQTGLCNGLQLASPAHPFRFVNHLQKESFLK